MLLSEGIQRGYVIPTDHTRKLTIDGDTKSYQVYRIRLDQLFFNDQNDRIATWISKYKEENELADFNYSEEHYNQTIEKFIYESNPKSIDKTKINMDLVGQREAGVVLNDGRIIDGNRRYTCLRKIHENKQETNHFEAVILNRNMNDNKKEIKLLELAIQHGEEGKIDYNPIDKLVGLYNDVVKNELITMEEYQKTVNEPKSSINKKIEQAKLMVEFLEFISAPEKFYIARDMELDGPLGEMPAILNKAKTEDEKEDLKMIIFSNLIMKPQGDITRFIRKIKTIVDSEYVADFIEEQLDFAEKTVDKIGSFNQVNSKVINNELRNDGELQNDMKISLEKYEIKSKKDLTRTRPLQDLQKCQLFLNNIDTAMIKTYEKEEKENIFNLIVECQSEFNKLIKILEGNE